LSRIIFLWYSEPRIVFLSAGQAEKKGLNAEAQRKLSGDAERQV